MARDVMAPAGERAHISRVTELPDLRSPIPGSPPGTPGAPPPDDTSGTGPAFVSRHVRASAIDVVTPEPTPAADAREARFAPILRWLAPVIMLVIATLAFMALRRELHSYGYHDIVRSVRALPVNRLTLALVFTVLGYGILPLYDALSLHYVGRKLHPRRLYLSSFVAYAISHNIGMSAITGASIRYRFWSSWGLSAAEIAQAVAFTSLSFWLGVIAVGGTMLTLEPTQMPATATIHGVSMTSLGAVGVVLLLVVIAYLTWSLSWRRPLAIRGWRFRAPTPGLALLQVLVATSDWTVAALVLYSLLPHPAGLSFGVFLPMFLMAQVLGLVSTVPGGLGVFETLIIALLEPWLQPGAVLGALLAYRAIYYLLPLLTAVLLLATYEVGQRSPRLARVARVASRWLPSVVPQALSITTFFAGAILLLSGSTPSVHSRVRWLDDLLPLGVIEVSHLVASLAGVGLLLLARGLARRLDAAYQLTLVLLGVGIVSSILKGLDYEEALALALVFAAVAPAHRHFYRRAALTAEPFTPGWIVAVVLVLGGSLWLGFFSFKHLEYSHALWTRFTTLGDAARFLRAAAGSVGVAMLFGMARLLRQAPVDPGRPTSADLARVDTILAEHDGSEANLALLGDKAILFGEDGDSFLMYGVSGRSWVALGDPVGAPRERAELAWRFREMADRHGGWTVFYQVGRESLPLYIDLGLTLTRLGEEARVPLEHFSLEGGARKGLRRTHKAVEKEGCTFEIQPPGSVALLLPQLEAVSQAWLAEKNTREKGFSLGRFDADYLSRFPVALVRRGDELLAFANVFTSGTRHELSVDLMRFRPDAPDGVMDFLFVELMLWGARSGYRWFNLGMAPFSGFEQRANAPRWHRLGSLVYRHGEHFYNFRGLRQYKDKFHPVWEPKYLASPGGFALPRILANVATLVSGGIGGVIAK